MRRLRHDVETRTRRGDSDATDVETLHSSGMMTCLHGLWQALRGAMGSGTALRELAETTGVWDSLAGA